MKAKYFFETFFGILIWLGLIIYKLIRPDFAINDGFLYGFLLAQIAFFLANKKYWLIDFEEDDINFRFRYWNYFFKTKFVEIPKDKIIAINIRRNRFLSLIAGEIKFQGKKSSSMFYIANDSVFEKLANRLHELKFKQKQTIY